MKRNSSHYSEQPIDSLSDVFRASKQRRLDSLPKVKPNEKQHLPLKGSNVKKPPVAQKDILNYFSSNSIVLPGKKDEKLTNEIPISLELKSADKQVANAVDVSQIEMDDSKSESSAAIKGRISQLNLEEFRLSAQSLLRSKHVILPAHYSSLIDLYEAFQSVMSFARGRKKQRTFIFFSEIRVSVERICRKEFSMERLAQIMYLVPNTIHVRYCKRMNPNMPSCFELAVDIDSLEETTSVSQLCEDFKLSLYSLICFHHSEFLKARDLGKYEKHLSPHKWHPLFKIHEVPSVPQANLPIPPKASKAELLKLTSLAKEQDTHDPETISNHDVSGVSQDILEKVKMRELVVKERLAQLGSKEEIQNRLDIESLPSLARQIRQIFSAGKRNRMRFEVLVSELCKGSVKSTSAECMSRRLQMLCEKVPKWCQKSAVGKIVVFKVNMDLELAEITLNLQSN